MATFKILVLPHQKREDGSYNVKIRLTQKRKIRYIKTGVYVTALDITKRKESGKEKIRIKNQAIIDLLEETLHSMKRKLIALGGEADSWDVDRVYDYLTKEEQVFRLDFIGYGRRIADETERQGRKGTANQYRIAMNALERFTGGKLDINQITSAFMERFEKFIKEEPQMKYIRGKGVVCLDKPKGGRALSMYPSTIKALHNRAKIEYNDEEAGVINIPYSPFVKYQINKIPQSRHKTLSIEQMQMIIDLPRKKSMVYNQARDLFLLSFALMGMNIADFYYVEDYKDGILSYQRQKTKGRRSDGAMIKVRVEPEIEKLFNMYRGTGQHVFRFFDYYKEKDTLNRSVSNGFLEIGKDIGVPELSFYYARHTFATLAANKAKIDIMRVDEMLNHSDGKLKLARIYIERDFSILWEENRKVISLLDWSNVM